MDIIFRFERVFPYALPPALTILGGLFLFLLTIRSAKNSPEIRYFTLLTLMLMLYNLDFLVRIIVAQERIVTGIYRVSLMVLMFCVPVGIKFVHQMANINNRKALERFCYLLAILFVPITQTDYFFKGMNDFYYGFMPRGTIGMIAFAFLSGFVTAYGLLVLRTHYRSIADPDQQTRYRFLFAGFPLGLAMIGLDMLPYSGIPVYPLSAFAFVPLGWVAYGMMSHEIIDTSQSLIRKGRMGRALTWPFVGPILIIVLYLGMTGAVDVENIILFIERFYPHGGTRLLSVFICMVFAAYFLRQAVPQIRTILFGLVFLLWGVNNLDHLFNLLIDPSHAMVKINLSRTNHFFLVYQPALFLHFIYLYLGRTERKWVYACYVTGLVLMPLTQTRFYFDDTIRHVPWGIMAQGQLFFAIHLIVWSAAVLHATWLIVTQAQRQPEFIRKTGLLLGGFVLPGILIIGDGLSAFIAMPVSPGDWFFVPVLIITYGIMVHDLVEVNVYAKKRFWGSLVRYLIFLGYLGALPVCLWAVKNMSWSELTAQLDLYDLPTALSFITCALGTFLIILVAQNQKGAIVFSLCCFLYSLLNLNLFMAGIITDVAVFELLLRWGQFAFVFLWGLIFHTIYIMTQRRKTWWTVYTVYAMSVIVAPLTLTDYYMTGSYQYHWGLYPKGGPVFYIACALWLAGSIHSFFVLYQTWKQTRIPFQKYRIKALLISFCVLGVLLVGDIPATLGLAFYPLSNLSFIPIILLAYTMLKPVFREQIPVVRMFLYWTGIITILTVVISFFYDRAQINNPWGEMTLIAGCLISYPLLRKSWNNILSLFIPDRKDELQKQLYHLTDQLSQTGHLSMVHQAISQLLITEFSCSRCVVVFADEGRNSFKGWETWNTQPGLFSLELSHPKGDQTIVLELNPAEILGCYAENHLVAQDRMDIMLDRVQVTESIRKHLLEPELTLGIFFEDQLTALMLIYHKVSDMPFNALEKEFLSQLGLILGPHIQHARLLYSLETQVRQRTSELSEANEIIMGQNKIFRSLLESSASIHKIVQVDEFFEYTLKHLKSLFEQSDFGLILHGERPGIVEFASFRGLSDKERKHLLSNAARLRKQELPQGLMSQSPEKKWQLMGFQGREKQVVGTLMIHGPELEKQSSQTITLFMEQVAAVAENRMLTRELEKIANTDGLTGTYNRLYFDRELQRMKAQHQQFEDIHFTTIMIDVNGLKRVNDVFGHQYGDTMIIQVAELLKQVSRKSDVIVRLGGDEFVILCPSCGNEQAGYLIERIREKEQHAQMKCVSKEGVEEMVPIHMSIGLASTEEASSEEVMKLADERMYKDKEEYYAQKKRYR
ncbi:MAG: diguanylate cyclase [SAR324 cluster bacterium]|nr:diguanylate cyclase [SAR324 cluster bacterium]